MLGTSRRGELGPLVQASADHSGPASVACSFTSLIWTLSHVPQAPCLPAPASPPPGCTDIKGSSRQVSGRFLAQKRHVEMSAEGPSPGTENRTGNAQSWRGPGPLGPRHVLVWLRDQEGVETAVAGEGPEEQTEGRLRGP